MEQPQGIDRLPQVQERQASYQVQREKVEEEKKPRFIIIKALWRGISLGVPGCS
jgi:hypothetical protein